MLQDFSIGIGTRFVFGKDAHNRIGKELKQMGIRKVLIHYGSRKRLSDSGLLGSVKEQLRLHGIRILELGGVVPNPRLSLVREGIHLARKEKVDMILAVGGGSVLRKQSGLEPWRTQMCGIFLREPKFPGNLFRQV